MGDTLIESVDVSVYTVPTDAPEADGTLSWDSTTMVLVQVRADGISGTGWTYGAAACATVITDKLAGIVLGRPALDVSGAFEAMVRAVRNDGRPGAVGYAISAIDVALWDLKARLLDLPLPRLLGAVRAEVPVYGSGGFTSYNDRQLRAQLSGRALEQRIPRVKIKVGQSWGAAAGRDLERMAQARTVIGAETELFVDANGGYGRKQAIRVMSAAADLDVRWLEEPVSSDNLDGLREIRDAVRADVTAGEYGYDLYYFRRMCAADAVDCLQADASRCGGITSGCASRPPPPPTAWRSLATPHRTCTLPRPPQCRTCGIWNGSTTMFASSQCSSTAPSTPPGALSGPTRTRPGWVLRCEPPTRNGTGPGNVPASRPTW